MTVIELYEALEARIPRTLSCPWDNDGLSVCPDKDAPVTGVYIALDATEEAVNAALDYDCNVLLTHHPLLFKGIKDREFFYFTHSYAAPHACEAIATTTHSITFPSAVQVGKSAFAVQFHPEKSSDAGLKLLSNFVELAKNE